jgi:hypothetical protein
MAEYQQIFRRKLLIGASAICSPALVPFASLMPMSRPMAARPQWFGFAEHLCYDSRFRQIRTYLDQGLSALETAEALNANGPSAMNGVVWTSGRVNNIVKVWTPRRAVLDDLAELGRGRPSANRRPRRL